MANRFALLQAQVSVETRTQLKHGTQVNAGMRRSRSADRKKGHVTKV